jgi:hypothetical protein
MISFKECADIIFWSLIGFIHWYSRINKFQGIDHKCDFIQEILFMRIQTIFILYVAVEMGFMGTWYHVPGLYATLVVVV